MVYNQDRLLYCGQGGYGRCNHLRLLRFRGDRGGGVTALCAIPAKLGMVAPFNRDKGALGGQEGARRFNLLNRSQTILRPVNGSHGQVTAAGQGILFAGVGCPENQRVYRIGMICDKGRRYRPPNECPPIAHCWMVG